MQPLHLLAKTAERVGEPGVTTVLRATPPAESRPAYPVLAWRQVVGRTACLCTRTWGDERHLAFWGNDLFQQRLGMALDFLTATTRRGNLALNPLDTGAELVWTGVSDPPARDLRLSSGGTARLDTRGRWLLEAMPAGEELLVFDGDVLLQRIPLPRLVPRELQRTGDDEAFFLMAEQAGVRVVRSLDAWQPRRFGVEERRPVDLTWGAAFAAIALLVGGFVLRRR
jgi:hypothetical protein